MIAACGAKAAAPVAVAPPPDAAIAIARVPMIADAPARPKVEARPAGPIAALSATAAGDAALTIDAVGNVQLWPTLDGTREPCLVDLADVQASAIARRTSTFFVAYLNAARDLELAELDDQGRRVRHGRISREARFTGVAMTSLGVLAWGEDQIALLYDFDGRLVEQLGTEPGQRIQTIVANESHVLAELELDEHHRIVRELVLRPHLGWAPPLQTEGEPRGAIAISASGKVAAVTVFDDQGATLRAFEIATGQTLARLQVTSGAVIGLTDDAHLAVATATNVAWYALKPGFKREVVPGAPVADADLDTIAISAGAVIRGVASSVSIATPGRQAYLGYGITAPTITALVPTGLVIASQGQMALLDARLREVPGAPMLPTSAALADLAWLGGGELVASVDGPGETGSALQLVASDRDATPLALDPDPAAANRLRLRTLPRGSQIVRYLPATQLLTLSFGPRPRIERWLPAQHKLARVAVLPPTPLGEDRQLVPLDPALADGAELLDVRMGSRVTLIWSDATAATKLATAEVMGFLAADAAGHAYAYVVNAHSQIDLAVLTRGIVTSVLPRPTTPFTVWPDPDGSGALELAKDRATLVRLDGTVVWDRPIVGGLRALWSNGSIVIATSSGLVQLDGKTGTVSGARCGWRFGLSEAVQPAAPAIEPVCVTLEQRADGGR